MKNQLLTFPQWERFLGGLCASGWGNVKHFFENVLLAGEMLKSAKPTFNIFPVGACFLGGMCFWLGKCPKLFRKCASGWGNSKNVKNGGEPCFVHKASIHKHGSPHFTIFNFFRLSPVRSTFSKKKNKNKNKKQKSPARSTFHFFFNFSPARSTFYFLF